MRELKYKFSEAQIAAVVKEAIKQNFTQKKLEFTRSNNNILINIPDTTYHNRNFQDLDNSDNRKYIISEVQKRLAVDETKATQIVNHFTGFLDHFQITLFEKNGLLFNLTLPQQSLGKITEDLQHKEFFKVNGDVYYKCREQLFLEFNDKDISLGEIEYTYRVDEERYTMTSIACGSEQLKNLLADPAQFTDVPALIYSLAKENLLGRADVTTPEIQSLIDLARHLEVTVDLSKIENIGLSKLEFSGAKLTRALVAELCKNDNNVALLAGADLSEISFPKSNTRAPLKNLKDTNFCGTNFLGCEFNEKDDFTQAIFDDKTNFKNIIPKNKMVFDSFQWRFDDENTTTIQTADFVHKILAAYKASKGFFAINSNFDKKLEEFSNQPARQALMILQHVSEKPKSRTAKVFKEIVNSYIKRLQSKGVDVTNADISDIDFSKEKLFKPFNLRGMKLTDVQVHGLSKSLNTAGFIAGANLSSDELSGIILCGANIPNTNFSGSILVGADFSSIQSEDKADTIPEYRTNLAGANFTSADLSNAKFIGADLREANFKDALLFKVDFSYADLRGAILPNDTELLSNLNLTGAKLDLLEIQFLAVVPELKHHIRTLDLTGLDLSGIDLTDVDLTGVDLNTVKIGAGDGRDTIIFGVDDQGNDVKGIEALKTETQKLAKQFKFKSIEELKTQMRLNLYVNTLKKQSHNNLSEKQIKNIVESSKAIGADLNKIAGLANTNFTFTFTLGDIEATKNHNVILSRVKDEYMKLNGKLLPNSRNNLFSVIDYEQKNPTSDTAKAFDHVKNDLLNDAKGISKEKTERARFDTLLQSCIDKKLFKADELDELVTLIVKYKIDISKIAISNDTQVEFACHGLNEDNSFPQWENKEIIAAFKIYRNRIADPIKNFLDLAVHAAKDNADSLSEISKAYNAARYSLLKNTVKSASINNGLKILMLGQAAEVVGINPVDFSDMSFSDVDLSRLDLSNTLVDGADFTGMTVSRETDWDGTVFCKTDRAGSKTDYAKCDSFTYLFKDRTKVTISKNQFLGTQDDTLFNTVSFEHSNNTAAVLYALQAFNTDPLKNAHENLYAALKEQIKTTPINADKIAQLTSAAKELNVPLDLSGLDLTGLDLSQIDLTDAIMTDTEVSGTKFNSTDMKTLDFSKAKIGDFRFLNVFGPEKQIITFFFNNQGTVTHLIQKNGAGKTVKKDILLNGLDTFFMRFNPVDGTNEAKLREIAKKTSPKELFKACDNLFKPVANTSAPSQLSLSLEGVSQLFRSAKSKPVLLEAQTVTPPPAPSAPTKFDDIIGDYLIKSPVGVNPPEDLEIRTKSGEGWSNDIINTNTYSLLKEFSDQYSKLNEGFAGFFKPNFLNTLKGTDAQQLQAVLKEVIIGSQPTVANALKIAVEELIKHGDKRIVSRATSPDGLTAEHQTPDGTRGSRFTDS